MRFESALKVIHRYVSEIYTKDDVRRYVECMELHDTILQSARIGRMEFHDAFGAIEEELERKGEKG